MVQKLCQNKFEIQLRMTTKILRYYYSILNALMWYIFYHIMFELQRIQFQMLYIYQILNSYNKEWTEFAHTQR